MLKLQLIYIIPTMVSFYIYVYLHLKESNFSIFGGYNDDSQYQVWKNSFRLLYFCF